MRLINLIIVNIKRYLKNPGILIMIFLLPTVILIGINLKSSTSSDMKIGLMNLDKSEYSNGLVEMLSEKYDIEEYEGIPQENYGDINDNKIGALYVIDKGFEEKIKLGELPKVDVYKQEASAGAIIAEDVIDKFIKVKLQDRINKDLSKNYIETIIEIDESKSDSEFVMSVIMICYFMFIGTAGIVQDIIQLKSQKVLKRTICTANTDIEILGSMFIAIFILQTLLSSMAYLVIISIVKIQNANNGVAFLVIALSSLVSTALSIATIRWLKNPMAANMAIVIFGLLTFGLGMVNVELAMFENVPVAITRLNIISPFNWFLKIMVDGEVIKPILVILLMSVALITAGSFRLRDFVKE